MHTSEEGCIRYLMKEMDPSEEVEFERLMLEDDDLLIETESLRNTNNKLQNLPLKHPPHHLSEQIQGEVARLRSEQIKGKRSGRMVTLFGKISAAAAALIMLFSAGYYFYPASDVEVSPPAAQSNSKADIAPWVDRNQVIRYSDRFQPVNSPAFDIEYVKSFEKLEIVNNTSFTNKPPQLLLTGSTD